MKKLSLIMCAIAMVGVCFTSCKKDEKKGADEIVEDGFYVIGAATAIADLSAENAAKGLMGAGINEVTKEARAGLYEKYVALEGGKDFELVLKEGDKSEHWGAKLELGDPYDVGDGVTIQVYKGEMAQNVKMQVPKDGFYHIALDLNVKEDLPFPSIIVAPVDWYINANSDKKLAASEFNKEKMTWTLKDIEMKKGQKYKYAYGGGWKIKVTPAAEVNIETNLGEGMKSGAADIVIENSGKYTFELAWELVGGAIEKNFKDNTKCTEKYEEKAPEHVYMIGEFCEWDWGKAFEMVKVHSHDAFWAVKFIKAGEGFKFNTNKEGDGGDFTKLTNLEGAEEKDGNLVIATDGFYLVMADYENDKLLVEPAKVYGMGDCFGGWDVKDENLFKAEGETLVATTAAAAELRMFAQVPGADWWQSEFIILDGKIVYRGAGDDQERVPVAAGKKVVLDFNAGTGAIQ